MSLTCASLFTGIGGADHGMSLAVPCFVAAAHLASLARIVEIEIAKTYE